MKELQDHIAQLKSEVTHFIQKSKSHMEKSVLAEKNTQLKSIEKTIQQMQKNQTPVPDELRTLKIRLVTEIAAIKDLRKDVTEMHKILSEFLEVTPKNKMASKNKPINQNAVKKKQATQLTVLDLINAGVITAPFQLFRNYKGQQFKAVVGSDGIISIVLDGKKREFNSPSAAAVAATGKSQNGWSWWSVVTDQGNICLDIYRNKLLNI